MKSIKLTSEEFANWLCDFSNYIYTIGYGNPNSYVKNVDDFLMYLESISIVSLKSITQTHLLYYRQYLINRKHHLKQTPLTDSSIRHHLISIKFFLDFLLDSRAIIRLPGHLPSVNFATKKPREVLSIKEIHYLFRIAKDSRDKIILCCAYGCGLRRNEIFLLNRTDLHLTQSYLSVTLGKGNKSRLVPIANAILPYFKKYLRTPPINESKEALLQTRKGERLSYGQIYVRFMNLIKRANLPEINQKHLTLHCLRHSIAVHLMDQVAGIEFVKDFLGHQSIDTTQLYAIHRKRRKQIERAFRC
jgi:integrase/recombinase XerD